MYFSNQVTLYFSQAGQLGISQSRHLNQFSDSLTLIMFVFSNLSFRCGEKTNANERDQWGPVCVHLY